MARIWIDGIWHEADESKNLLDAALSLGYDLPYFCWHPAMGSVGACRQCAVKQYKDEQDDTGRVVMACMTPASDGTRIAIENPEAAAFRASVIEWLMENHPHDCPICDEGGECHLQDMTVMTGHSYRRYRFKKRTYRNQYLGPVVNHEMNRCIQCYRCVRFYRDYAGGDDLKEFAAHNHVYFGRSEEGTLESEFSGNLVEICPTGVFTDKTLKDHYTRKWDLQTAPSVCVHCGLGCNTTPGERYGVLRRIRNRYHHNVNGYFLCDRGRYGYEFVNHERRIREVLLPRGPEEPAARCTREEALDELASWLGGGETGGIIGIGSPRASLEANYALRTLVGPENFYAGVEAREKRLLDAMLETVRKGMVHLTPLGEVSQCDAVIVLGEDPTNTAPMLDLAIRQAARRAPERSVEQFGIPEWQDAAVRELVQGAKGPVYIASPAATKLDAIATLALRMAPEDTARLGMAIAHVLDERAPGPELSEAMQQAAHEIAGALLHAHRPLIVTGTACGSVHIIQAAGNLARALAKRREQPHTDTVLTVPECNSMGLQLLGGGTLHEAFQAIEDRRAETVVILENDLYRRAPAHRVTRFLSQAKRTILLDHTAHDTGARADMVVPVGTFAESSGTLVNNEGRAQRFHRVVTPNGAASGERPVQASWHWLRDVLKCLGRQEAEMWGSLDEIVAHIAQLEPVTRLPEAAPDAGFRIAGTRIPRQPWRYSGRTAMAAHKNIHEQPPPEDPDSPLSYSMEGFEGLAPSGLTWDFWAPGWNSVQALTRFQEEVNGPLRGGDPGVRLIASPEASNDYYHAIPEGFVPRSGEWRLVYLHHIFGSDELSVLTPGVAERSPAAYVAMHPSDAEGLGVRNAEHVHVELGERSVHAPVRLMQELPEGVAGLPAGLAEWPVPDIPDWARITTE